MSNQEMTPFKIIIEDTLRNNEITNDKFYYNHPDHKLKIYVSGDYKDKYRAAIRWDLGDGTIIEAPEVSHYYKNAGIYKISATLYGTDGTIHHDDIVSPVMVIVKELIPTELEFVINENSWHNHSKNYVSKNNNLGKLKITIGNNIVSYPDIAVYRQNKGDEKSYFDVKNDIYYHLNRYYTFLEEIDTYTIGQDPQFDILLRPTKTYTPSYIPLFAKLEKSDETDLKINLYYLNDKEISDLSELNFCKDIENIPDGAVECGKVGFVNIWYKNDNNGENNLIFEIKKDTLKIKDETSLNETYLNIPPLGFTINLLNGKEIEEIEETEEIEENKELDSIKIKALTNNGLYKKIKTESNEEKIDNYLKHNFFKDYTVDAYYSYFIENDILNDKISYNLLKIDIPDGSDELSLNDGESNKKCEIKEKESEWNYLKSFKLKPLENFSLYNNEETIYVHDNLIALDEIIIPSEKTNTEPETLEKVLNTYMKHQMFDETPNLKTFLKDSLNPDTFNYILTKGDNFFDDYSNIKTCYIDSFLSMMEMINEPIKKYKLNSFNNIKELKEFMRILSMNYSTLFGNVITTDYDIKISNTYKGKHVGEKLEVNDTIFCNKNYEIIGFRHENHIYKLVKPSQYIIIYDNVTSKSRLSSFYNLPTSLFENFNDQTPEWKVLNDDFISKVEYVYNLNDYEEQWGWDLLLPDEINYINDKHKLINNYYTFYIFNPLIEKIRKNNFIKESTIPLIENEQISVADWNDSFGFTYNCLMKILLRYLNED